MAQTKQGVPIVLRLIWRDSLDTLVWPEYARFHSISELFLSTSTTDTSLAGLSQFRQIWAAFGAGMQKK